MKENQEYIRKRRPINFTLDDLENDEQDETFDYKNFDPMPSTSRALPSRICRKNILYDDKYSSDFEDESDNGDNMNDENYSDSDDELEQEENLNESAKNSTQDEVSDTTEVETDEEENKNNGEFNWSDIDFEEMYNDKDQMKKINEYDEECRNSKFVIVETPIHPPNESSDEDNEEKLYALGFL